MEINWFQIVAQVINFFILLYLLNRFFYKPVISAMARRESSLAEQRDEARRLRKDAEQTKAEYDDKLAAIEETRRSLLEEAKQEAAREREAMHEKHLAEIAAAREKMHKTLRKEEEAFLQDVRSVLGTGAVKVAGDIIAAMTDEEIDQAALRSFLGRLGSIDVQELRREGFDEKGRAVLTSYRELKADERERLEDAVRSGLGFAPRLTYEVDRDMLLGFSLSLSTLTVQNSAIAYLKETEAALKAALELPA